MKRTWVAALVIASLLNGTSLALAMSSVNYQINWDDTNGGGGDTSTSTNYSIRDTIGGVAAGTSTSASYQLSAGYRAPEGNDVLSLVINSKEAATETAYTALSVGSKTVTPANVASFSVGNYIAVVENKGFSQKVIVGKITDINLAGVITVDAFDGATGLMSAVPAGANDFVYRLGGTTLAFGTISASDENTSVAMSSVLSSIASGYTVYIQANQALQNAGAQTIASVADGTVTSGVEEYGASVTGTRAYNPDVDYGVTTTQRAIQSYNGPTVSGPERVVMNYKLSITGSTQAGSYGQDVFYTLTANY